MIMAVLIIFPVILQTVINAIMQEHQNLVTYTYMFIN